MEKGVLLPNNHHSFWNKQGGTIGIAYGIMTEEQEKVIIDNHFGDYLSEY